MRLREIILSFALQVSWRKTIHLSSVDWMSELCIVKTLCDWEGSHILLQINLQDPIPLLDFHADKQWPWDLGQGKKKPKQQPRVPFQVHCITAVGKLQLQGLAVLNLTRGRSQKHFPCGSLQAMKFDSVREHLGNVPMARYTGHTGKTPNRRGETTQEALSTLECLHVSVQEGTLLEKPLQYPCKIISPWLHDATSAPEWASILVRTSELKRTPINSTRHLLVKQQRGSLYSASWEGTLKLKGGPSTPLPS